MNQGLIEHFESLPNPRVDRRKRYPLIEIIFLIIAGMVSRDGNLVMSYGVMGGEYQAYGHMQFLTRMFDFGLDIQETMDLPRIFPDPRTGDVQAECALPQRVADDLRAKGHTLAAPDKPIGGSQAVWIDWDEGVLTGGSDPRKDGCALGY